MLNSKLFTVHNLIVIGLFAIISHALMTRVYDIVDGKTENQDN